jgi:prepilin-type processing-associated H-X9-DG protein
MGGGVPLTNVGWGDIFNNGVLYSNSYIPLQQITDGTSNTLAVGESVHPHLAGMGAGYLDPMVGGPTFWSDGGGMVLSNGVAYEYGDRLIMGTKFPINSVHIPMPQSLKLDLPYGSNHPGGAQFVFCDGSVHLLSEAIDYRLYQALATRNGGEAVTAPD